MAKTLVGALALASLPSALGFRNTSPFFLFSTADLLVPSADASIAQSSKVTADVLHALRDCPTRSYIVVEQQGVSSDDYVDGHATPRLGQYLGGKHQEVRTTVALPDTVGQVDAAAIISHLQTSCSPRVDSAGKMDSMWFTSIKLQAPAASRSSRLKYLLSSDDMLEQKIVEEASSQDYTVIYITSPQTDAQHQYTYPADGAFGEHVQMELKRDMTSHIPERDMTSHMDRQDITSQVANQTNPTEGGLFERYQYFTPGLFMGFMAIIPLFLILLVGIRALTGLEVSYFAFSKEMGPNAQKKQ